MMVEFYPSTHWGIDLPVTIPNSPFNVLLLYMYHVWVNEVGFFLFFVFLKIPVG